MSKDIHEIIKEKNFKTLWHCFDYLLNAGYKQIEAFHLSLKEFGEDELFKSVLFIRDIRHRFITFSEVGQKKDYLKIGIVTKNISHLSSLFSVYRRRLFENENNANEELEALCENFQIYLIDPLLLQYIEEQYNNTFGFNTNPKKQASIFTSPSVTTREFNGSF